MNRHLVDEQELIVQAHCFEGLLMEEAWFKC